MDYYTSDEIKILSSYDIMLTSSYNSMYPQINEFRKVKRFKLK